MERMIFKDRVHAGQLLADTLVAYADRDDVIVLGLPRGGVPVAFEVAKKLHAPMDVCVVRKLGVPGWEELAMGAIASGGVRVINEAVVSGSEIIPEQIEQEVAKELKELHRREMAYRGHTGAPDVVGKTIILVDDGIATGSTIRAAVLALRQQRPQRIVIAVPTAAADSCNMLEPLVDELVTLIKPMYFHAVGQWYADFPQTTDSEVKWLLAQAASMGSGKGHGDASTLHPQSSMP
jgi:putative phosphoribosyl transferase